MPNVVGIFSLLTGIILLLLSSLGLVAIFRLRGVVANVLAFAVLLYATVVVLALPLSELHAVSLAGFLVGHALIALAVLPWAAKTYRVQFVASLAFLTRITGGFNRWIRAYPPLAVLGLSVLLSLGLGLYLILAVPPNIWDSLSYSLPRVAQWLRNETLRHFLAYNLKQVAFPINAEIGQLWLVALWGNDRLGGFIQWIATMLTMVSIYGVARQLRFSPPASIFAALIWSTFTIVVLHATSTKNDTLVAFFFVTAFYFLLTGLRQGQQRHSPHFILFGVSFGLAAGTKSIVFLFGPGLVLLAVVLILHNPHFYLPKFLYAALWGIIGFGLLGFYNYGLNWLAFNSLSGPDTLAQEHLMQAPSLTSFLTNLGQIAFHFFDPGGLPDALVDSIQQWRPGVGQKLFNWFVPNALETGFSFTDARQVTPREDGAWFGPLGALLFWPVLFFYLLVAPFTHKSLFVQREIWKWSIALMVVSFVIIFALLFRWNPWIGRMFIIAVALGAPLMAGFYTWTEKIKPLRWAVIIIAIVVLGWTGSHNFHKPVLGLKTIWAMDYYDLRTIQEPEMAAIYRYVDAHVPADARLGLAGEWPANRWDYLFLGPNLTRSYAYIGSVPKRVTHVDFVEHNVDFIILASETPGLIDSETPLWPIGLAWDMQWFLVKRSEAERYAANPCQPDMQPEAFGAGYEAYNQIKQTLQQKTASFRVLTTDPRMTCYQQDKRFVFDAPSSVKKLEGFTHLVIPAWWSTQDYQRLDIPLHTVQDFLLQTDVVEEAFAINGYLVYRILL